MRLAARDHVSVWTAVGGVGLGLLLIAAACGGDDAGEDAAGNGAAGPRAQINMISNLKFDRAELVVPSGQDVTISADNQDGSVPHNFSIYASSDSYASGDFAIASTEICSAPCVRELTVNLVPGSYYFVCEVHPFMAGNVIAES